jgi:hypothetical protein
VEVLRRAPDVEPLAHEGLGPRELHTHGREDERAGHGKKGEREKRTGPGQYLALLGAVLPHCLIPRSLARSGAEAAVGIHGQRGNQPPRLDFGFPHGRGAKGEDPAENESPAAGNAGGHLRTRALGFARSYL